MLQSEADPFLPRMPLVTVFNTATESRLEHVLMRWMCVPFSQRIKFWLTVWSWRMQSIFDIYQSWSIFSFLLLKFLPMWLHVNLHWAHKRHRCARAGGGQKRVCSDPGAAGVCEHTCEWVLVSDSGSSARAVSAFNHTVISRLAHWSIFPSYSSQCFTKMAEVYLGSFHKLFGILTWSQGKLHLT